MDDLSEAERQLRSACDALIEKAAETLVVHGVSVEMLIDRMITYAVAQACVTGGSAAVAAMLRVVADKVDEGLFHSVTGEGRAAH